MKWLRSLFGTTSSRTTLETPPDQVYLTVDAKLAAINRVLGERANAKSASILLVAHFPQTLRELQAIVESSDQEAIAVLASDLITDLAYQSKFHEDATIDLIVAERHALLAGDQRVLDFAKSLPCRARVTHLLSLDDGLFQIIAGDNVRQMLRKMGQEEHESVTSSMVTRRVRAAQRKLTRSLESEYRAQGVNETDMCSKFEQQVAEMDQVTFVGHD